MPTPRITPADLQVQQALDRAALVPDDSGVMADTKDGIITLAGHVHTWAEHDAVAGAALMARGVIDIRDDFRSPADRHRQGAAAQRGFPDLGGHYHRQRHGTGRSRLPQCIRQRPGYQRHSLRAGLFGRGWLVCPALSGRC